MASTGDQLPDSNGYNLHARLIGGVPEAGSDLFLAIFFGIAYWAACAYGFLKWSTKRKKDDVVYEPFKTWVLFWVSFSLFWLGLAFFLRAGLAGTAREKRSRGTYIAEQIFFVVVATIWVDSPVLSLTRDVVYIDMLESDATVAGGKLERPLPKKPKHWFSRFTMIARFLLIISGVLAVYGFTQLPNPGDAQPPSKKSSQLRLAAALIQFLIILLNMLAFGFHVVTCRLYNKSSIKGRVLVLFLNLFFFVTILYNFVIVAVTDDYSPLLSSKTFFYFAYIFFPTWMIILVIGLEINLWTATKEFAYFNF